MQLAKVPARRILSRLNRAVAARGETLMQRLAGRLILLWGWRRAIVAFVAGALAVLALAPFNFFPALAVSLPVLIWLIDGIGSTGRGGVLSGIFASLVTGWSFGFGYFVAGLYWIGAAFLVDAEQFAYLMPFAVIVLPAGLALFHAAGVAVAWLFWSQGAGRIFALAAALAGAEWLRGHLFTGFPWNLFGYSLAGYVPLMQGAAYIGIYGLTFLALFIFASPAMMGTPGTSGRFSRLALPALGLVLLAGLAANGWQRLPFGSEATPMLDGVRFRLVQPNVPQDEKWRIENRSRIFSDLVALSDRATSPGVSGIADVTHVVWPETAPPFLIENTPEALAAISAMLPDGTSLITGAIRRSETEAEGPALRNSVIVFSDDAEIVEYYDKHRLVPFGEFLPFQGLLEKIGFEQLTRIKGGFLPGSGPRSFELPMLPAIVPLVCYEVIFAGELFTDDQRPGLLLNLTNDAWFGVSLGPYQHLQQARLRAVEEGLPLIRVANTGISAIIDPFGRVLDSLALGATGVIDTGVPEVLSPTIYSIYRDRIFFGILAIAALLAFLARSLEGRKARTSRRQQSDHMR